MFWHLYRCSMHTCSKASQIVPLTETLSFQMIESVAKIDNILSQEVYCSQKSRGCRKTMFLSELEVCNDLLLMGTGLTRLSAALITFVSCTLIHSILLIVSSQILPVRSSPLSSKVRSRGHHKVFAKPHGH